MKLSLQKKSGNAVGWNASTEQPKEPNAAKDRDIFKIRSILYSSKTKQLKD